MATMRELLEAIYPLKLAPVSTDMDRAVQILTQELDGTIHEFDSGLDVNGWVVPQKWGVIKAEIRKDGKCIYDGMAHPLGVTGYSQSFRGRVSLEELDQHLHSHVILDDTLVYHFWNYYRNWEKQWGFTMPRKQRDKLTTGEYEIDLVTKHEPGKMKVFDFLLPGESEQTICFIAHNCHAGQANDDIAGVVVGVELMKRLAAIKDRRYSYRLVVGPEQFASVFFLDKLGEDERKNLIYGVYLEMLGHENRFALQESFNGDTVLDETFKHVLNMKHPDHHVGKFREVVGNDETVWEAPGYEIPCVSFSRSNKVTEGMPYPEYHSDKDNGSLISDKRLEEAVEALEDVVTIFENNVNAKRRFTGHIALSNPRYNLYSTPPNDPLSGISDDQMRHRWFSLQNRIMRYFDRKTSSLQIARDHELPFDAVRDYLGKFEAKGLVDLSPAPLQALPEMTGEMHA